MIITKRMQMAWYSLMLLTEANWFENQRLIMTRQIVFHWLSQINSDNWDGRDDSLSGMEWLDIYFNIFCAILWFLLLYL